MVSTNNFDIKSLVTLNLGMKAAVNEKVQQYPNQPLIVIISKMNVLGVIDSDIYYGKRVLLADPGGGQRPKMSIRTLKSEVLRV